MKKVFYFLTSLFVLAIAAPAFAQTHTPRYISMSSKTHGYYEYLPEGYDSTGTATYPLILFMTGIGEYGNGTSNLPTVLKWGVPKEIKNGTFPTSFTVNGQVFRFIVITPQFIKYPRPEAADMDTVLNYIVSHYKVDVNRIYITGLSYGGGLCWAYTGANNQFSQRIAAIVPVASPIPDGGDTTIYARSRVIAANNVAVWATHNLYDQDDTVATTISYVNDINQPPAPTPPAKMTIFNAYGHDAWGRTYPATFKENGMNIYEWMLQYHRGNTPANQAPQATAGADQSITLPTDSVTLNGSGTDADGSIIAYNWAKVAGPDTFVITSPEAASTTVTGLVAGTYTFRLTVTDNKGATATDDINVAVNAAVPGTPQADAGPDQTIKLPQDNVALNGKGSEVNGTIVQYNWSKVSGPDGGTITAPGSASTTITGLTAGTYVFRLTVTDGNGATAFDDVSITVTAAANTPPTANAGADTTIVLPANTVTLSGSGSDADGTIASYLWRQLSGPAAGTIADSTAASTSVSGLVQGTYTFQVTVTDNSGATASDTVSVVVNAAPNMPPQVFAGDDQAIVLPVDSVTLSGSAIDADGTVASYSWTKIAGPDTFAIASPSTASTQITRLTKGTYIFRLTVTDDKGATAFDDVTVTVMAAPDVPPQANAGPDQQVTLPVDHIMLRGAGTDTDGSITAYQWAKVSGPDGGDLTTPTVDSTEITKLQQGTYVFRLTVTDNKGVTASDDVTIEVRVVTAVDNGPAAAGFDVRVAPNPTASYFTLKLQSPSAKPAYLRVTDALGRVLEERSNVQRNTVLYIGQQYQPGVYHAEFIQNGRKLVIRLLKLQ